jgi:GTP pyrophosphokinase
MSPPTLTKSQIDRLGDRLRCNGALAEAELRQLDSYRRSFRKGYDFVVAALRDDLGLEPTGRPAKSTASIRDKLRRETLRLSQMQDIAGCRIVVESMRNQESALKALRRRFAKLVFVDRRQNPSYGYRAVHAIVRYDGKVIEIQIRTQLQHGWAELSEKLADVEDPSIKYGGGTASLRKLLDQSSGLVGEVEEMETVVEDAKRKRKRMGLQLQRIVQQADANEEIKAMLPSVIEARNQALKAARRLVAQHKALKVGLRETLSEVISKLSEA